MQNLKFYSTTCITYGLYLRFYLTYIWHNLDTFSYWYNKFHFMLFNLQNCVFLSIIIPHYYSIVLYLYFMFSIIYSFLYHILYELYILYKLYSLLALPELFPLLIYSWATFITLSSPTCNYHIQFAPFQYSQRAPRKCVHICLALTHKILVAALQLFWFPRVAGVALSQL